MQPLQDRCSLLTWLIALVALSPGFVSSSHDAQGHHSQHIARELAGSEQRLSERYAPDFAGIYRSIVGRQDDQVKSLSNNAPAQSNIEGGQTQYWTFSKSALQGSKSPEPTGLPSEFSQCPSAETQDQAAAELRRRQDAPNFYLSLNTCDQPTARPQSASGPPDQLQIFYSTDASNSKPSSSQNNGVVNVTGGYGGLNLTVNQDVFIAVTAPSNNAFTGNYNYEITGSIDDYYAKYNQSIVSNYIDSDNQSVLIYTSNTTSCNSSQEVFRAWRNNPPPYSIFLVNETDPSIVGLEHSMCGLSKHAQVKSENDLMTSITLAGKGLPKQQFYISNLNAGSSYLAIVGLNGTNGNSSSIGGGKVNGGGTVWATTNFTTKSSPNCALIYDLEFCSDVAYAVPSNSTNPQNMPSLRSFYDNYANNTFQNFVYSLQQIPCNTTDSAQYSLAVTCDDCTNAYKNWLCAVTIPRCEDFSNNATYLLPRAVGQNFTNETYGKQFANDPAFTSANKTVMYMNSSRNALIDTIIKPGPYKELLPCEDLCYGLVRSCPAALGFACPLPGHGLNYSYAKLQQIGQDVWTCNFPGMDLSAGAVLGAPFALMMAAATFSMLWMNIA